MMRLNLASHDSKGTLLFKIWHGRLHLFDQKYSKPVKLWNIITISISIYFKMLFISLMAKLNYSSLQCHITLQKSF